MCGLCEFWRELYCLSTGQEFDCLEVVWHGIAFDKCASNEFVSHEFASHEFALHESDFHGVALHAPVCHASAFHESAVTSSLTGRPRNCPGPDPARPRAGLALDQQCTAGGLGAGRGPARG